jgi:type II secretory ATPase GspE/PulE/Tfp pilus assembly ATPase PilB-like protein
LLERLKYSSNLKLNITNIPQDWKYSLNVDWNNKIDVRVSTLPTKYWENVVSRILDNRKNIVDFEQLWFFWMWKRLIENAIKKKNWMILVTWPTWSGKTTTLYTILSTLNIREKKIMTLEDPIEYEVNWIIQSEVNEKNWFTFETWLKALLRQDPDIIMVWEIRDYETLNTATSASLTWHLVLSTLHTKSATETLDRIINMWLKPYIVASALDVIIAQRLVRKICPDCKVEKEKKVQEIAIIKTMMDEIWMKWIPIKSMKLYEWLWCENCNHSWYKWRIWIFEIINISWNIKELIRASASSDEIFKEARNGNLITMREDWILKAMKWYISLEELLRVI